MATALTEPVRTAHSRSMELIWPPNSSGQQLVMTVKHLGATGSGIQKAFVASLALRTNTRDQITETPLSTLNWILRDPNGSYPRFTRQALDNAVDRALANLQEKVAQLAELINR